MLSTVYSWLCRSTQAATTSLDNALVGPMLAMFGVQTNQKPRDEGHVYQRTSGTT